MKRSHIKPLHQPADIYAVLSHLQIGEQVPPQVYIADYTDDTIPPWTVREIEAGEHCLLVLTVCDETAHRQMTVCCVGRDIFTLPTKTLAGPFYGYAPGCVHARQMLADIRQHARQISERRVFESEETA